MAKRIHFSELERMLADPATSDEALSVYLKPAQLRALPLAPLLTVDATKVDLPRNRGILGLTIKSLNDRANHRRLAAYKARMESGWKGVKLLAEGDSWFLYPILLKDIIDNLSADYAIYSMAAAGDTLENMVRSTAHFEALIAEHKFDGFLLSAGGNDIAGDLLRTYLSSQPMPIKPAASYLNDHFDAFLSGMRQRLEGLFAGLTQRFPDLKIFCHGYDWPFPRSGGLWLAPALVAQRIPDAVQHAVLKIMIDRYYQMLGELADKFQGKVFVADCRGSVGEIKEWFDELHPLNPGYARAAERFRSLINATFGLTSTRGASDARLKISWYPNSGVRGGVRGSAEFAAGKVVTIGRSSDNAIVIPDEHASRYHARIEVRGAEAVFTDLNTTNGSLLDGKRQVGGATWRPGQKVQIGDHVFELAGLGSEAITIFKPLRDASAPPPTLEGPSPQVSPPATGNTGSQAENTGSQANRTPAGRIEIVLASGSITDVAAPAYAVAAFEHINPTAARGPALSIDAKLGGMLSTMVQGGMFESRVGQVSLVPLPHQRSLTGLIAFVGLGAINAFGPQVVEIAGEKLAKALSMAKILEFATVPFGVGTGVSIKDFLVRFLTGFLRGLTEAPEGAATTRAATTRKMSICEIDPQRSELLRREVQALKDSGFFARLGYELVLSQGQTGADRTRGGEVLPGPHIDPVYLQAVRTSESTFEYCILSAELGAAVQLYQQTIAPSEQARIADTTARLTQFDATSGTSLASAYVPSAMQELICRSLKRDAAHLVIIHDQASAIIPWEAFYFKDRCPALEVGVSRLYRVGNRERVSGRPILSRDKTLHMLVIENPTGDLVGAQNEGDQLAQLFQTNRGDVRTLAGPNASRANVLSELSSGTYDILHYAGHADFSELSPQSSGLILHDGRLTAADLLEVGRAPQMIFLNACESGRIRGSPAKRDGKSETAPHFVGQVSLAESFLLHGIANFIGTYWPVNDDAAFRFAKSFYTGLLSGKSLSVSMREARQAAKSVSPRDWANYLHFGDPLYIMRRAEKTNEDLAAGVGAGAPAG